MGKITIYDHSYGNTRHVETYSCGFVLNDLNSSPNWLRCLRVVVEQRERGGLMFSAEELEGKYLNSCRD